jgi:hypothetical protein
MPLIAKKITQDPNKSHLLPDFLWFRLILLKMIDRFYAAPLMGEMAVAELQSKRRPRPWER